MKNLLKRIGVMVLILSLIMSMFVGCRTSDSEHPVESENAEDHRIEQKEEETQISQTEKEDNEQEEYYSLDSVQDDKNIDYSKYEEKKTKTASAENKEKRSSDSYSSTVNPHEPPQENSQENSNVTYSNGDQNGQDEYMTDPIPEGMQNPVEPDDVEINKDKELTCYLTISCATILNNMEQLTKGKEDLVPSDGIIYARNEVTFYEGESVFDILLRETKNNRIHMEYSFFPGYNSNYVEGINNLYEFDCGELSGWMYRVNGWYPNYGCSRYVVQDGDEVEWNYTCDHGRDVGRE